MEQQRIDAVDEWMALHLLPADPLLDEVRAACRTGGLPEIEVSPLLGSLLGVLAGAVGAKRILEIGTLGGYSSIGLARALGPDGKLVTIEANPRHAEVARANFARAGLGGKIDLRVGAALEVLPELLDERLQRGAHRDHSC